MQLETAIRLYFDGGPRAAVVTLAGAAEALLGKFVTAAGGQNALESLARDVNKVHTHFYGEETPPKQIISGANSTRDILKHWNIGDREIVKLDLEMDAKDMLFRATENYWKLEQKYTPLMEEFQRRLQSGASA